jgi:acetylornithine deacetylase
VDVIEHRPCRMSVVGRLAGSGEGRSLMLNAHMDTVGVDGMRDPFAAEIRDGRLYGRGAYDMKGSLAACLGAVKALRDAGMTPRGDVIVAAVADEEVASMGTSTVLGLYPVAGAIVTEPTSLDVCVAHKGFVWAEVETRGRAAHGSRPDLGVDANLLMGRVLRELAGLEASLGERTEHELLGRGSLHAGTLHGGSGMSTYADRCVLGIERRTLPGETESDVGAEIETVLRGVNAGAGSVSSKLTLSRPAFEAQADSRLVPIVGAAARHVLGREPRHTGETPWMDSALLAESGADVVVIGPHGAGAHAREEWVDLESVLKLTEILALAALGFTALPRRVEPEPG